MEILTLTFEGGEGWGCWQASCLEKVVKVENCSSTLLQILLHY